MDSKIVDLEQTLSEELEFLDCQEKEKRKEYQCLFEQLKKLKLELNEITGNKEAIKKQILGIEMAKEYDSGNRTIRELGYAYHMSQKNVNSLIRDYSVRYQQNHNMQTLIPANTILGFTCSRRSIKIFYYDGTFEIRQVSKKQCKDALVILHTEAFQQIRTIVEKSKMMRVPEEEKELIRRWKKGLLPYLDHACEVANYPVLDSSFFDLLKINQLPNPEYSKYIAVLKGELTKFEHKTNSLKKQ